MMQPIEPEPGMLNQALEDALANAPDEFGRAQILHTWIMLGVEYMARERGREAAMILLRNVAGWVKDARPARPWPD